MTIERRDFDRGHHDGMPAATEITWGVGTERAMPEGDSIDFRQPHASFPTSEERYMERVAKAERAWHSRRS